MWTTLLILSGIVGAVFGFLRPGRSGIRSGGIVPWLGLLMWQLYHEYVAPYAGGGASMWPLAQVVAGTPAALMGMLTAAVTGAMRQRFKAQEG